MQRFWQKIADPDARAFTASWLVVRDETMGMLTYVGGLAFHLGALAVEPFVAHESYVEPLRWMHLGVIVVNLVWLFALRPRRVPGRHFAMLCHLVVAFTYAAIARHCHAADACRPTHFAAGTMCFVTIATALLIILPFHRPAAIVAVFAAYCGLGAWILLGSDQFATAFPIVVVGCASGAVMRAAFTVWTRIEAQREFKIRRQIAPLTVVRRSTEDPRPIDEVFAPAMRPTVCVSSDWRNYQSLSSTLTPEALAAALNAYYEMCERVLAEVAPNGDYYSDWIADELFIVFFAEAGFAHAEIVCEALRFAERLLEEKARFVVEHQHPRAIDIGVAAGAALVGMMGPEAHRKATALGEVPGRARRLQIVGKKLRADFGERDRVIFGKEVLALVGNAWPGVSSFELPPGQKLRDLDDGEIFFLGGKDPANGAANPEVA